MAENKETNPLKELADCLEREHAADMKARRQFWAETTEDDLPCINASYGVIINPGIGARLIKCRVTGSSCVCTVMSSRIMEMSMNQNYTACPGYRKR